MLAELLGIAERDGVRALVGGISGDQAGSLALHRQLGFEEVGRLPEIGQKLGRTLDLVLMMRRMRR